MLDSFAHSFSQARSVQAQVRALKLFAQKHPGLSQINIESMGEGALASFGAPDSAAKGGHEQFLALLKDVEELMALEYALAKLQELGADSALVEKVYEQARVLVKKLYPGIPESSSADKKGA